MIPNVLCMLGWSGEGRVASNQGEEKILCGGGRGRGPSLPPV